MNKRLLLPYAIAVASGTWSVGCGPSSTGDSEEANCSYLASGGPLLVDDLEDGDGIIAAPRTGFWSLQTGTPPPVILTPPSGTAGADYRATDDGTGNLAIRATGERFTMDSASLRATLRSTPGQRNTADCFGFDASAFTGITFRMKRSTGTGAVRLNVFELQTTYDLIGGTCKNSCNDHFGSEIPVSSDWTDISVRWRDLTQVGWGDRAIFDPAAITTVEWLVFWTQGPEFDIWVDDLAFMTD